MMEIVMTDLKTDATDLNLFEQWLEKSESGVKELNDEERCLLMEGAALMYKYLMGRAASEDTSNPNCNHVAYGRCSRLVPVYMSVGGKITGGTDCIRWTKDGMIRKGVQFKDCPHFEMQPVHRGIRAGRKPKT